MDLSIYKEKVDMSEGTVMSASVSCPARHKSAYSIDSLLGDIVHRHRTSMVEGHPHTNSPTGDERHDIDVVDLHDSGKIVLII